MVSYSKRGESNGDEGATARQAARDVKRRELANAKENEKAVEDNDQKYFNTENGPITQ